ncbi:MAG TPA: hypothetical protein VI912_00545 [Candidatus Bilamarchaeaceae archaeon]|nr:hypothetical protein [Candidatus Bilamarchaeaceae archaeon]
MRRLAFFLIFVLIFLFGCSISKGQSLGCCDLETAGDSGNCLLKDEDNMDMDTSGFDDFETLDCLIADDGSLTSCIVNITVSGQEKTHTIPVCSAPTPEQLCLNENCTAMVCGPFNYAVGVPMSDLEVSDAAESGKELKSSREGNTLPVGSLANSSCSFINLDDKLKNVLKNADGSFINIFRTGQMIDDHGVGEDPYFEYIISRYKFPASDKFCNAFADAPVDRFTNYLVPQSQICDFKRSGDLEQIKLTVNQQVEDYWEQNSCVDISNLPPYLRTSNYCIDSDSPYCVNGNYVTSYDGSLDVEFYKKALRYTYRDFINNPSQPKAPFECRTNLECKSGYCSKDDYSRSTCPTADGGSAQCFCTAQDFNWISLSGRGAFCDAVELKDIAGTGSVPDSCGSTTYNHDTFEDVGADLDQLQATLCYPTNFDARYYRCVNEEYAKAEEERNFDRCDNILDENPYTDYEIRCSDVNTGTIDTGTFDGTNFFFVGGHAGSQAFGWVRAFGSGDHDYFTHQRFPLSYIYFGDNGVGHSMLNPDSFRRTALATQCNLVEGVDYTIASYPKWLNGSIARNPGSYDVRTTDRDLRQAMAFVTNPDWNGTRVRGDSYQYLEDDDVKDSWPAGYAEWRRGDRTHPLFPLYWIVIDSPGEGTVGDCLLDEGFGYIKMDTVGWCQPCTYLTSVATDAYRPEEGEEETIRDSFRGVTESPFFDLDEDQATEFLSAATRSSFFGSMQSTKTYIKEGIMPFIDITDVQDTPSSLFSPTYLDTYLRIFGDYGAAVLIVDTANSTYIPEFDDIRPKINLIGRSATNGGCPNCLKAIKIESTLGAGYTAPEKLLEENYIAEAMFRDSQVNSSIDMVGFTVSFNDFLESSDRFDCSTKNGRIEFYDFIIDSIVRAGGRLMNETGKNAYFYISEAGIPPDTECFEYGNGKLELQGFMNRYYFSQYKFTQNGIVSIFFDSFDKGVDFSDFTQEDIDYSCDLQQSSRLSVNPIPNFIYKRISESDSSDPVASACLPCSQADIMLGKCKQPDAKTCIGGGECTPPAGPGPFKCQQDTVLDCSLCNSLPDNVQYDCAITYVNGTTTLKTYKANELDDKRQDIIAALPPSERCCIQFDADSIPYTYGSINIGSNVRSSLIYSPENPGSACPGTNDFGSILLDSDMDVPMCSSDLNSGAFKTIFDTYTVECERR